ncbi:hypothetical protein VMCG_08598 [Cytospora schulzeri]|uniref:Uncharacterized protein n=1 Tax=Cytospora schulzeri TaxID=448051 RepID=A0A423VW25_9PEZI|nr:hypothetical protein VMCG_08598 [Valsa malicola]
MEEEEEEQRILCPSCHCDLVQPKDGPFSDVFIYATQQQMRERHLTCDNFSCPIYIEGQPQLHNWIAKGEGPGDQHPQPTSQDKDDNDDIRHLKTAVIDSDPVTPIFVNDQAIADCDDVSTAIFIETVYWHLLTDTLQQLQHAESDGGWAPYSKVIFVPVSETVSPFDITGPFIGSPGPFLGATPDSATGQGFSVFQSPAGTGYPVPVSVSVYSPIRAPSTLPDTSPNTSPNASPVPAGTASESLWRQNSTPAQKPRASIRNRYTEHEIDVIMQMKAQGHGNDKIAQPWRCAADPACVLDGTLGDKKL